MASLLISATLILLKNTSIHPEAATTQHKHTYLNQYVQRKVNTSLNFSIT
ncbi:hypothetical protein PTRA_a3549 [Pseudoalteromonas translucida KMM 520]|uniref:Uncharacterized protein n=1 Tax=Pseudoalteromonas translucida KMM 520 TaxID=1315283 RepID=A0A0U2WRK8_9GAMM|nr:hypothetical protein PTRA_a3549 [Pseudoalteromonas translucida KMM 520]